jgi:hypothetical protein
MIVKSVRLTALQVESLDMGVYETAAQYGLAVKEDVDGPVFFGPPERAEEFAQKFESVAVEDDIAELFGY